MSKPTPRRKSASTQRRTKSAPRLPQAFPVVVADESSESPFPIVGVGASAGGLEAFTSLLQSLAPEPGVALVFIQHLDPSHESLLATLLAKATQLPVLLVEDEFPRIGRKRLVLNARRIEPSDGSIPLILLAMEEAER